MIDDTKEYIACSAIHYDNGVNYSFMKVYGIETGFVLAGLRHPFIASILPTNVYYEQEQDQSGVIQAEWNKDLLVHNITQGFMTSHGRFVDRREAKRLAIEAGQVKESEVIGHELFSEDVFKYQRYYAEKLELFKSIEE